ncbi:hypothetical protein ONS95_010622 [Cadophora gregata]|uniref:uncharacterized protein n=1 Tax=Cadophora gregata TaxID=51156 RepID=UPI0026DCB3D3|nr:uncharacterized protein ONS95_010622 [Cadophora gregata]KAK0122382.1 hypothetical protein ONS95_010622 [Cadophora gregata]
MSDTETATANGGAKETMSQQDVEFLLTCLRNSVAGSLTVDATKIAVALNYSNPRSVTNKISLFKKKYNLAISTAGAKAAAAAASASAGDGNAATPTIPKTPAPPKTPKGKITKGKATPKGSATKKTPVKKAVKSAVKAEDDDEEADADEEMEDAKDTTVKQDDEA